MNPTLCSTDMSTYAHFSHEMTGLGRPKTSKHAVGKSVSDVVDHVSHWAQLKAAVLFHVLSMHKEMEIYLRIKFAY